MFDRSSCAAAGPSAARPGLWLGSVVILCLLLAPRALRAGAAAAVPRGLPAESLVPPPEPPVKPIIVVPPELNGAKIDPRLAPGNPQARAVDEPVRIEVLFSQQITQAQINAFIAAGGTIEYIYKNVSYGWNGSILRSRVAQLPALLGASLVAVLSDQPLKLNLLDATRNGRVRPVWAASFAGTGFIGTATTTIAILDTGVDTSHPDLAGREEYWKDYTSDALTTAVDYDGHGSHVAGIAFGSGQAIGPTPTQVLFTLSQDFSVPPVPSVGQFYPQPIHLPAGPAVITCTATFNTLFGSAQGALNFGFLSDGSTGIFSAINGASDTTGPSPLPAGTGSFAALDADIYTPEFTYQTGITQYALACTATYAGAGDGFNALSGVAPGCHWAGGKVFGVGGSSSTVTFGAACDDMVAQRIAHNIKVVNMSLDTGTPNSTLRAKVNSMVGFGMIVCAAAGNDGGAGQIYDPGLAALAVTVGASNRMNQLTEYTSSGVTKPGSNEDVKPDLLAPGGSAYYGNILSVDTNNDNAQTPTFPHVQPNDYTPMMGTSMSSPFAAGCAALVIEALEQSGTISSWDFNSSTDALLVKMLLCATATQTNQPREAAGIYNPILGRATTPKDRFEGYGILNPDAAIECVMENLNSGTLSDSTAGGIFDRRAWGRQIALSAGQPVVYSLAVPPTGDFDLYLYAGAPDAKGNPVILASSTNAGLGVGEIINYTPTVTQTGYLVVKLVSGNGAFTLTPANYLVFVQQPANTQAGTAIVSSSPPNPITVQIFDPFGNPVSSSDMITLSIGNNPSGGTLSGTVSQTANAGQATFSDLSIDKVGTGYTLIASASMNGGTSAAFDIVAGPPAQLAFALEPGDVALGAPSYLIVQILDAGGNLTSDTSTVSLAIGTNPSSADLNGTTSVQAVAGVAVFDSAYIDQVGLGYTLIASDGALPNPDVTSAPFKIMPPSAAKFELFTWMYNKSALSTNVKVTSGMAQFTLNPFDSSQYLVRVNGVPLDNVLVTGSIGAVDGQAANTQITVLNDDLSPADAASAAVGAANLGVDTKINAAASSAVILTTTLKTADGTTTVGKTTEVGYGGGGMGSVRFADSWVTRSSSRKTLKTWSESTRAIALSRVLNTAPDRSSFTVVMSLKKGAFGGGIVAQGSGTIKDAVSTIVYSGGSAVMDTTSTLTFQGQATKLGVTYYLYYKLDNSGATQTETIGTASGDGTTAGTYRAYNYGGAGPHGGTLYTSGTCTITTGTPWTLNETETGVSGTDFKQSNPTSQVIPPDRRGRP